MSERTSAGQVALVTGASRGIGHAIALALAGQGMKVIGTSTTEAGAASVTAALAAFPDCSGVVLNVEGAPHGFDRGVGTPAGVRETAAGVGSASLGRELLAESDFAPHAITSL